MKPSTIRGIHSILSGAFAAAQRWEWTDRNPAESAKPPTTIRQPIPATSPEDVAKVIAEARARSAALGLYLWLVVVTGVRRGELCGLQIRDIDLDRGLVHVAFNYVVRGGQRVRKDTKTHQDRWLAIDPDTCALIATYLDEIRAALAAVGVELRDDAYLFSNDPAHARPWNPDWATHKVAEAADAAGVELDIKGGRHYTASQLLAGGFDLRNTAARLGHSGGGATTLRHYADPVPEVDQRAAAYLAELTAGSAAQSSGRHCSTLGLPQLRWRRTAVHRVVRDAAGPVRAGRTFVQGCPTGTVNGPLSADRCSADAATRDIVFVGCQSRDHGPVIQAMQRLPFLGRGAVGARADNAHQSSIPGGRAPSPGEDIGDPYSVAPRPPVFPGRCDLACVQTGRAPSRSATRTRPSLA